MKSFYITFDDLSFINQQISIPEIRVLRYLNSGTAIYGYTDPNTLRTVELGTLGSFNLMTSPWAAFLPNTTQITNTNSSPFGIRDVSGLFNNLTQSSTADWGATNYAFARNSNSDYSQYLNQSSTNNAYHALDGVTPGADNSVDLSRVYANPFKTVWDYTPRMISQAVHSQAALERMDAASSGTLITDHVTYDLVDPITN